MDPNTNLREQLALAQRLINAFDTDEYPNDIALAEDAQELASLVIALDEWLKTGGFLPKAWRSK